ncbi:hypothetical protein BYT27DRAFT_7262382 [Phlegmacium glaucopus]|nr:hypothetical protein BYT27DRAFT_7262382 [Phlegmacium glaucopus]
MDSDNPALNANGMLKDASKIKFFNLPSDKQPLAHPMTTDQDSDSRNSGSDSETSEPIPCGLKGKQPAIIVAGKHVQRATSKARMQKGKSGNFFEKNFIVDSPTPSGSSHFFKKQFIVGSPNASSSKHAKKVNLLIPDHQNLENVLHHLSRGETMTREHAASTVDTTNTAKRPRTTIEDKSDAEDIIALDNNKATKYTSNIDNEKEEHLIAEYKEMKETFQKVYKAPQKH